MGSAVEAGSLSCAVLSSLLIAVFADGVTAAVSGTATVQPGACSGCATGGRSAALRRENGADGCRPEAPKTELQRRLCLCGSIDRIRACRGWHARFRNGVLRPRSGLGGQVARLPWRTWVATAGRSVSGSRDTAGQAVVGIVDTHSDSTCLGVWRSVVVMSGAGWCPTAPLGAHGLSSLSEMGRCSGIPATASAAGPVSTGP